MEASRELNQVEELDELQAVDIARNSLTKLSQSGVRPLTIELQKQIEASSEPNVFPLKPRGEEAESITPRQPFVSFEEAKSAHPDVFEAEYDAGEDRLLLREMVKSHKDDSRIMARIDKTYLLRKRPDAEAEQIEEDPFYDLLTKAANYRILTREEETELFINMKLGVAAYKKFLETREADKYLEGLIREGVYSQQVIYLLNIRLAAAPARKYSYRYNHTEMADGLQYSLLGLQAAIEKFDEKQGFKFSTYATWWLTQSVDRYTANEARVIRMPIHVEQKGRKLYKTQQTMENEHGRALSREELFDVSGMSADEFDLFVNFGSYAMTSLNKRVSEDGDTEMGDLVEDTKSNIDQVVDEVSGRQKLEGILEGVELSKQELMILSVINRVQFAELEGTICLDGRSYEEVFDTVVGSGNRNDYYDLGQAIGLSSTQVKKIEEKVFSRIHQANS